MRKKEGIASIVVVAAVSVGVSLFDRTNTEAIEQGQSLVFPQPEESEPAPVPVDPENLEDFDILPVYPMIDMGDPVDEISFPESEPTVIQSPKNCPPTSSRKRGLFGSSRGGWSLSRR